MTDSRRVIAQRSRTVHANLFNVATVRSSSSVMLFIDVSAETIRV
jgi:hypothetical protein